MKQAKKDLAKKVIAGVLTLGLFALAGCGSDGDTNKKPPRDPDHLPVYTTDKTFRTAAWSLPPNANTGTPDTYLENNPNYATQENYQTMRDCGFEYCMPTSDYTDDHIRNTLTQAAAVGMKVLVRDYNSRGVQYTIAEGGTYAEASARFEARSAELKARYDEFKTYSSFAGVIAYDEPNTTQYEAIAAGQDWFLKNYPGYEYYVNLLPNYAKPDQLFGKENADKGYTYADHVNMFVEEVNPQLISYDHYALVEDANEEKYLLDDFYYNLYVFAVQAKKMDIPFYIYLQTMGFYNNVSLKDYAEFAWQSYTSMAFGVTGIQCFCYWTLMEPEDDGNNVHEGIVDRDGTKLESYEYVQTVFNEIRSFEQVFMSFKWDGFKTYLGSDVENGMFGYIEDTETEKKQLAALDNVTNVETDQDLIIGQFFDEYGYPGYMVANASNPFKLESATVTLTFDSKVKTALVYVKGEEKKVPVVNGKITLELGSGVGAFVVPV